MRTIDGDPYAIRYLLVDLTGATALLADMRADLRTAHNTRPNVDIGINIKADSTRAIIKVAVPAAQEAALVAAVRNRPWKGLIVAARDDKAHNQVIAIVNDPAWRGNGDEA